MNLQDILNKLKSYEPNFDENKINKAIDFATKYYNNHKNYPPLEVAELIVSMYLDSNSVIASLLYNSFNEANLTIAKVRYHFGVEIAKLINNIIQLTNFSYDSISEAQNFRKLLLSMNEDTRIKSLVITWTFLLYNLCIVDLKQSLKKHHLIVLKIIKIYIPLIETIGINQIKIELQDLCFKILQPEVRSYIFSRLQSVSNNKEKFINSITNKLYCTLHKAGMSVTISGRLKTPYSIWVKMQQKNIDLEQLSDIIAFRIIVSSKGECYKTLNIIHNQYNIVPRSFQDFISNPKNNGYQSLHITVIGLSQQHIEVQIRTKQMHDEAEYGIAAHWKYKQLAESKLTTKNLYFTD